MFKEVYRIDSAGFHIETLTVEFGQNEMPLYELEDNVIVAPNPRGLHLPRWNGEEWVEGKSQAEIDADDLLESLKPKPEEIANAEFELKTINILMEVGLI